MVSKSDILTMAKTVKEYYVKNKTYPKSLNVKGTTYSIQEATYLMCAFIVKPRDDIKKISVGGASAPTGDRVNRKVNKTTYVDMSKRTVEYIEKNKKLPNYVIIKDGQKCSIILWILQVSKILSYYKDNNKFGGELLINSNDLKKQTTTTTSTSSTSSCKNPYKATPYNEGEGCDAMGQNTGYFCACSMVQKMLYRLGIRVSQSTLASVMGTTSAGTGHDGIETGIAWVSRKYNVKLTVKWYNFSDLGWKKMGELMCAKNTAVGNHLLYRDQWGHYEYPLTVNTDSQTVKVINSLGYKCGSSCYCGYVEERSFSTHRRYMSGISQKSVLVITKK